MEQDITDEIIKFLRISVTNVFLVVLLNPYFSSITNVEYIAKGISRISEIIIINKPRRTAPSMFDVVIPKTISVNQLSNPPRVKSKRMNILTKETRI